MRDSKKAILAIVIFLLCVALCSSPFVSVSGHSDRLLNYTTLNGMESLVLPPDTDYLFCGSSQCAMSFIPDVIDPLLQVHSYNLSVQAMKWRGRYELLKHILPSYKIKTVILEISYDSLTLADNLRLGGDLLTYQYFKHYLGIPYQIRNSIISQYFNRIQDEYNLAMNIGFENLFADLRHQKRADNAIVLDGKKANRGYERYPSRSVCLFSAEADSMYETDAVETAILPENEELLVDCIQLCQEYGAKVSLVVVPVSEAFIWSHSGLDEYFSEIKRIAAENNVPYCDYNLLRNRTSVFSDIESFYNTTHLCQDGADTFSRLFANCLPQDHEAALFFDSYASLKQNFCFP